MENLVQKIETMLKMQDVSNCSVHPEWKEQNFNWSRAIWIECAELMEHFCYKWWKKQEPDIEQVKLEIVDIWHFGMSAFILDGRFESIDIANCVISGYRNTLKKNDVLQEVEYIAQYALMYNRLDMVGFFRLMKSINMPFDELYELYICKNVLNKFRWDNGYKTGDYEKIWKGKEDNVILMEIIKQHGNYCNQKDYPEFLYRLLSKVYDQ